MPLRTPADHSDGCVVGIDVGAGSLKACVVDGAGRELGSASHGYTTRSPHPGWSEQDPEDWWLAVREAVPRALQAAGVGAGRVRGICFSGGAHTPVLLDAGHRVLRPAILWSDQRSGEQVRILRAQHDDAILQTALNRASPTWTLPQLMWVRLHEPEVAAATRRVMLAKDWIRWRMASEWHTDVTDAVGTLLWDYGAERWSDWLCDLAGWNLSTLPPVVRPAAIVGAVTPGAAAECGLAAGTPVVCGTSDTSAEAFGAGADVHGAGVIKLATAATVSIINESPRIHPTLINYPFAIPGLWYTISATNSCASAHRWLRDQFFMHPGADGGAVFAEMDALACEAPPGSNGLLFHPYLLGERAPYWDPRLRADFIGMTMRHDRRHFVRALYEGIAFSLRDVLEQFRAQDLELSEAKIIGGGARSALWRQIVADVLQVRVVLPAKSDASFGAALLAGVAVGLFADERSAAQLNRDQRAMHEPDPSRTGRYTDLFGLYRESKTCLTEINYRLGAFEQAE